MFKRGVITDEISQDFRVAADLASKYKLDGVEIRSVWEKGPHELGSEDIREIRSILSETGLQVCAISSPFYKCDIDSHSEIEAHMDILKRCMELAHMLGTDIIRGFTFWNKGDFEKNLLKIVANYEAPLRLLEKENLILGLEFDDNVMAHNARKLRKVLDGINSPYIRAVWDPGNDIYDPDGEIPFPDGYNIIKPYMVHMHLKDAKKLDESRIIGVPIGEGQVDYEGHFRELIESSYNGYVVLETHYRPQHELSDELLALPKGSAFSYMGYEATEECLKKWEKLVNGLTG